MLIGLGSSWITIGSPPSEAAMFDVDVRTASAIAPMSACSRLAKSAATRPHSVLKATALGPK